MSEWIKGEPIGPGYYWCCFYDQGGWPWMELCSVWKGLKGVLKLSRMDGYSAPLNEFWNLTHHMKVEKPVLPVVSEKV